MLNAGNSSVQKIFHVCYHTYFLLQEKMLGYGLSDSCTRRPLNLTQLHRNKRHRADKTSRYLGEYIRNSWYHLYYFESQCYCMHSL